MPLFTKNAKISTHKIIVSLASLRYVRIASYAIRKVKYEESMSVWKTLLQLAMSLKEKENIKNE